MSLDEYWQTISGDTITSLRRARSLAAIDQLVTDAIPPTIEALRSSVVGRGHLALVMSDIATEQLRCWYERELATLGPDIVTVDREKGTISIQKRARR